MASEPEVPDPDHPRVVADETLGGEPRIRGRRITVLDVYDGVVEGDGDMSPEEFAATFRLDVAEVYAALAYYHDHPEEMARLRQEQERALRKLRERIAEARPDGIDPGA